MPVWHSHKRIHSHLRMGVDSFCLYRVHSSARMKPPEGLEEPFGDAQVDDGEYLEVFHDVNIVAHFAADVCQFREVGAVVCNDLRLSAPEHYTAVKAHSHVFVLGDVVAVAET